MLHHASQRAVTLLSTAEVLKIELSRDRRPVGKASSCQVDGCQLD